MKIHHIRVLSESRLGHRGVYLLGLAVLDVLYGFSMIRPDGITRETAAFVWRDRIMPTEAWGTIWICAGLFLLVNAFLHNDRLGYGAAIAIKLGWAFLSCIGWLTGDVHTGWVSMGIWGVFGWVTISESLRGEPVRSRSVSYMNTDTHTDDEDR